MSVKIGTATDVGDLLSQLDAFLTVGHALEPQYTATGDGTIDGLIGTGVSVAETITVTFTSATAFDVSGSVSGALGSGTVGVAFSSTVAAFTISAGGTAWVAGDVIAFFMTPPWVQLRANNVGTDTAEYIWKAPGNDGTEEIFVGGQRFASNSGDYDNVRWGGFTGYTAANTFAAQPGAVTRPVTPLLRSGAMPFWFIANGRRVVGVVRASTSYESFYLGFIKQYMNPTQLPYPLAIGGSMSFSAEPAAGSTQWRWSYAGIEHSAFPKSALGGDVTNFNLSQLRFRNLDGTWYGMTAATDTPGGTAVVGLIYPYNNNMQDLRPCIDGSYPLFPIILAFDNGTIINLFGELDGVLATTGHGNASENTFTVGRSTYLVVQDTFRTNKKDYYAVKLA